MADGAARHGTALRCVLQLTAYKSRVLTHPNLKSLSSQPNLVGHLVVLLRGLYSCKLVVAAAVCMQCHFLPIYCTAMHY